MKNLKTILRRLSVLMLGAGVLTGATSAVALTDAGRAAIAEALEAGKSGDYRRQFRMLERLVERGAGADPEDFQMARAYLYQTAFKLASSGGEENCDVALRWSTKGTRHGPPDYTEPFDNYYPLLLTIRGACLYEKGDRAQSRKVLQRAARGCRHTDPPEFRKDLCAKVAARLELVDGDGIAVGDYVTHRRGFLQKWIGRVVDRAGDKLEVRITYVNHDADTGFDKGDTVSLLSDEVKVVKSVSPDAALRGWK